MAKRAAKKGAKYYHITRQWQEHGNKLTSAPICTSNKTVS
ncbi:YdgH/BhsA/McbA-like domain containing protein [Enterobacter hormaechei]